MLHHLPRAVYAALAVIHRVMGTPLAFVAIHQVIGIRLAVLNAHALTQQICSLEEEGTVIPHMCIRYLSRLVEVNAIYIAYIAQYGWIVVCPLCPQTHLVGTSHTGGGDYPLDESFHGIAQVLLLATGKEMPLGLFTLSSPPASCVCVERKSVNEGRLEVDVRAERETLIPDERGCVCGPVPCHSCDAHHSRRGTERTRLQVKSYIQYHTLYAVLCACRQYATHMILAPSLLLLNEWLQHGADALLFPRPPTLKREPLDDGGGAHASLLHKGDEHIAQPFGLPKALVERIVRIDVASLNILLIYQSQKSNFEIFNTRKLPLRETLLKESEVKGGLRKTFFCKILLQNLLFAHGNLGNPPRRERCGDFYPIFFGHINLNV
nr:MAG TPA: hypothetical protein [Bacteriophage sp.]